MNLERLISSLDRFQKILPVLIEGLDEATLRWKPPSGNWSILEIVCHLADEEVEDFRVRIRLTLEDCSKDWPPIDPEGVVTERNYNDQDIGQVRRRFLKERQESLSWLRGLQSPDWDATYNHPTIGPIAAGDVLAAWVAHDHLHARQIVKRLFEQSAVDGQPYSTLYAGSW